MMEKWVLKANNEKEAFNHDKLASSLFRSGANEELIDKICYQIIQDTPEITTTKLIYKKAYQFLAKESYTLAGKYKLKTAILELGPSGYPFERFIARLFEFQGFEVEVGRKLNGKNVAHEVDVVGSMNGTRLLVECKHHSHAGYKSDIKVPLYVHSRFNDICKVEQAKGNEYSYEFWIATNTRFTSDAELYAAGEGLRLMAWDYPKKGNLKERIAISGYYPITCLRTLTKKEKNVLLSENVVLCKDLLDSPELLSSIDHRKHEKILRESELISNM